MEVDALVAAFQKKGLFKGKGNFGKGKFGKGKGNFKGNFSKGKGKGFGLGHGYFPGKGKGKKGKGYTGGKFGKGNFGKGKSGKGKGKTFHSQGSNFGKVLGPNQTPQGKGGTVNALASDSGSETLQWNTWTAGEDESWNTLSENTWEVENWDQALGHSDWSDTSNNFDGWVNHFDDWWDTSGWEDWTWGENSSGDHTQANCDTYEGGTVVSSLPTTAVSAVTTTPNLPPGLTQNARPQSTPHTRSRSGVAGLLMATLIATFTAAGQSFRVNDLYKFSDPLLEENLIANFMPDDKTLLFDSGASVHCCPLHFAEEWPLLPLHGVTPNLKSVTGEPLTVYGKRIVGLSLNGTICHLQFYVCDVHLAVVSVSRLLSQGFTTHLSPTTMTLTASNGTVIEIHRKGHVLLAT